MKLSTTLLLSACLLAVGCSKPASNDVASNAAQPAASTSTTTESSNPTPVASTTDGAPSPAATTGTTTPSGAAGTPPPMPSTTNGKPAVPPPAAPGASTPPPAAPNAPNAAPAAGAPGQQQQMTDAQKKQLAEMQQKQMKAMKENADKAEKAKRTVIPHLSGKYILDLDDALAKQMSSIDAAVAEDPSRKSRADAIKAQIKTNVETARKNPPSFVVNANGDVLAHTAGHADVKGYTALVDGKPSIIVINPNTKAGGAAKIFVLVTVQDGGKTMTINGSLFRRA